jgi:hypothetical protein
MENEGDNKDETVEYIIGDGIITYYTNGIFTNYKIIQSNELKRKTECDPK